MEKIITNINIIGLNELLNENGELFDKEWDDNCFLPLNLEVLAMLYHIKEEENYHASYIDCYPIAAKNIIEKWGKALIPVFSYKTVKKKMMQLMDEYRKIKKKIHRGNCHSTDLVFLNELFNISSYTCINFDL